MNIAVIGAGIAGLACAWRLSSQHRVTLFEANDYLGGHTNTVEADVDGVRYPVDTGFLVFNDRTYPGLTGLFAELGVATAPSDMSFSARVALPGGSELEWAGSDLASVFAQPRNLARPAFLRMLADIVRFNRLATETAAAAQGSGQADDPALISLGDFLEKHRFSAALRDWYLLPMAAAIWSCPTQQMLAFPLATFVRFCANHGLLQISDRPQWRTVVRGGQQYVKKLVAAITANGGSIRRADPVRQIRREGNGGLVAVHAEHGTALFDHVVLACHSDQAAAMLTDASPEEAALLGAVRYQRNRAVLHTDASVLPRARRAWAAWNYQSVPLRGGAGGGADGAGPDNAGAAVAPLLRSVCVHYLLNRLQPVPFERPVLVSLNPVDAIAAEQTLAEFDYAHPVFDRAAIAAQERLPRIQGVRNTWYCGAWTGYGFHEDGLQSGLAVARQLADRPASSLAA